jgi:hypothetical protein
MRAEQGQEPERREGEEKRREGEEGKIFWARREERLGAGSTRGKIWQGSTERGKIRSRLHRQA